ncbi:MAG: UDP-N-acetylmuramoyl-tripeptide--D-alanyl-D-alanine ligase [Verrucomicrobium sp.]|nr:UDP-N-acetylmuramoyl-tripeptide--D-alanyl-D-alanine ligase [Verrucomicrobium sp.]
MEPILLRDLAAMMDGAILQGEGTLPVARLHTDSRTVRPGDGFVALVGDRFDGHDYLAAAAAQGAVAGIVSRARATLPDVPPRFGLVAVSDTVAALQRCAVSYRQARAARVVAVTGSSGKTSTKEMIAAVLGVRFRVAATQGNLNNHLGVPLTLLRIEPETDYAVVEMGMNHRGEIAPLAAMAAPSIAVVTGVGSAHIEHLGSREAIAEEKTDLVAALPEDGAAILNGDDPLLRRHGARARCRIVWTGSAADAAWRAEDVRFTPQGVAFRLCGPSGAAQVLLPVHSRVMIGNALLAAAVGAEAGLSVEEIASGLSSVRLAGGRMEVRPRGEGWLIDDSYNANPESMEAALASLREFPAPGRRVAVLGSMGELGAEAPALHRRVGAAAAQAAPDLLVVVGPHAAELEAGAREGGLKEIRRFATTAEAAAALPALAREDDTVLIKGSRFMKLEAVAAALGQAPTLSH